MRWDVTCGLGSEMEEEQLVKVGAQILGRFEEVTTLKVVTSKVDV